MAETIFINGDFITMTAGNKEVEAVAVKDDKILAVGDLTEIMNKKDQSTSIVDLNGATLLPGLIEPHTHPILSALDSFAYLNMGAFEPGATADVSWAKVKKLLLETPKGQWCHINGLNPMLIDGLDMPTKEFLDGLSTDHPITMMAVHVHTLYCNSLAFARAGVDENTPSPPGGEYMKDGEGKLNGQVNEISAMSAILRCRPGLTRSQGKSFLERQTHVYAKHGYTTIAATGLFPNFEEALEVVPEVFGNEKSPVRLIVYYRNEEGEKYAPDAREAPGRNPTVLGVKFWADGSPYAGTMATNEPFLDSKLAKDILKFSPYPNCGELNFETDALYEEMMMYHKRGLQIVTHAHGERSIEQALEVYGKLLGELPRDDHRYRLEHCGLITKDQLRRAKTLGVTVSFYPDHIYFYGRNLRDDLLGEDRAARFMPIKWAEEIGVRWTLHSDTPCCPLGPFRVLRTVTTRFMRRLPGDSEDCSLGSDQVIDIKTALKGYTTEAAWQIFHEDQLGSLEVGKLADFTILSANPTKVEPSTLDQIEILSTYRNGSKVTTWS